VIATLIGTVATGGDPEYAGLSSEVAGISLWIGNPVPRLDADGNSRLACSTRRDTVRPGS